MIQAGGGGCIISLCAGAFVAWRAMAEIVTGRDAHARRWYRRAMETVTTPGPGPMDETEVDALARLLDVRGRMPLEAVDGLFSAAIVGPGRIMPSECLPLVWGEDGPEWETTDQALEAMQLLLRLWNHVAWRVAQPLPDDSGPDEEPWWLPFLAMPDDFDEEDAAQLETSGFPFAAAWSAGFLEGVSLRGDAWAGWFERHEDFQEDLEDVLRLATLPAQAGPPDGPEGEEAPGFAARLELSAQLPYMLEQMHLQRLEDMRSEPIRRASTAGRNDPCPCGSGRKFKRCCGGGATRH